MPLDHGCCYSAIANCWAGMRSAGAGCRLQTCRRGDPQRFNSAFPAMFSPSKVFDAGENGGKCRSRQDSNLRGQSPVDFWSTPLTAWVRPYLLSGETAVKGTDLELSAGKEYPVEFDSNRGAHPA